MKRTKLNRKSKSEFSKIQEDIWEHCKRIIRKRYQNICYTCGASGLEGSNWQTGHMIAKAALGAYLKYDLRLLRPQCFRCNIHHGGMGATFIENMRMREGDDYVDGILRDRIVTVKAIDHFRRILEEYKNTPD